MRPFLAIASLLLPAVSHADLQCMERYSGSWQSYFAQGNEMTATHCAQLLTFQYATPQVFRLKSGPIKSQGQTTCQWSWIPSGSTRVLPDFGVPDSIICNFYGP